MISMAGLHERSPSRRTHAVSRVTEARNWFERLSRRQPSRWTEGVRRRGLAGMTRPRLPTPGVAEVDDSRSECLQFQSVSFGTTQAPFAYKPTGHFNRQRAAKGVSASLDFAGHDLKVQVHLEIYDGIPLVSVDDGHQHRLGQADVGLLSKRSSWPCRRRDVREPAARLADAEHHAVHRLRLRR